MTRIEQYKRFLEEIGWDEFGNVEKQYLFDDINGDGIDNEGILFNVRQSDTTDGDIVIEHKQTGAKLEIPIDELQDFNVWLEKTYAGGEDGSAFFSWKEQLEKEDSYDMRDADYEYQQARIVSSKLKDYFSPHNIMQGIAISCGGKLLISDLTVFVGNKPKIVIEIKSAIGITKQHFERFYKTYSEVADPNFTGTYFVFTDGIKAVSTIYGQKETKITSFERLLKEIAQQTPKEREKSSLDRIKNFAETVLNNLYKDKTLTSDEQDQRDKLLKLFKGLKQQDIQSDPKDASLFFLSESKEVDFITILLGAYQRPYINKYGSTRGLYSLLSNKTMNMSSLVCMNDPSETIYADQFVSPNGVQNDDSVAYIISASDEERDDDLMMWRLYGDDAKGVCFQFEVDKQKLKTFPQFYLAPISYEREDKTHMELEIIKGIFFAETYPSEWKIQLKKWQVWKHFFKKNIYAYEKEVRLLYMPSESRKPAHQGETWFEDDRTGIYSETKLFDLTTDNAFPLTINKITLGPKFRSIDQNVKQFNQRLLRTQIITKPDRGLVFQPSKIKDYR